MDPLVYVLAAVVITLGFSLRAIAAESRRRKRAYAAYYSYHQADRARRTGSRRRR